MCYVPFHVDYFASIFMENFRLVATTLSEAKVSEYISLCDYIQTQFLGTKPWSFTLGHHYNFYKNVDSDLTSNACESTNNQINQKCVNGKKKLADLILFFTEKKRDDYNKKLFAFRDNSFNLRKKSVRDRYTKQAEIFRQFDSLSTENQLSNLMQYCYDMGSCS